MRQIRFFLPIAVVFLLSGCGPKEPEPILTSGEQPRAHTPAEKTSSQPPQSPSADAPLLANVLADYYAQARIVASGGDRGEYNAISQSLDPLIEGGKSDLNRPNDAGVPPLMMAVQANDPAMVARLIRAGADADAKSPQGLPMLSLALQEGTLESARALINHGADLNVGGADAPSPLTVATLGGITSQPYREMALTLLDQGADPDYGAVGEHTLLLYAIKTAQDDLATALINHGADTQLPDENGMSALSWAIVLNQNHVVSTLLDNGASGDVRDAHGYTPLAWAVLADNDTARQILIDAGFTLEQGDRGWAAAQIAKNRSLADLEALLAGQDVSMSASTPLSGSPNIVRFKQMGFLHLEYADRQMAIKTIDPVRKHFMLSNPDRLVVDFERMRGVENITLPLQDGTFQKVSIGRHAGWYRVVIQLDRGYKYDLRKGEDGPNITLR